MTDPFGQPSPHNQPQPGYGPPPGYPQQPPGYGQPQPGYPQQPPAYGQPPGYPPQQQQPAYGQPGPPPGYGQPPAPGGYPQQPGYPPQGNPYGPMGGGEVLTIPGVGQFKRAGMGQRFAARLIDGLIIGVPLAIVNFIVTAATMPSTQEVLDGADAGGGLGIRLVMMVIMIAATAGYEIGMLASKGATIGKNAMGVRIVTAQTVNIPNAGLGGGVAGTRWAVFVLPSAITCGLWGLICALSPFFDDANRQGFHDKAAKTYAISTK